MAGPWEKYGTSETSTPSGPWSKYAAPDQEREKIVSAYAEEIMRRNDVYGGIPKAQLQDPERLWKLATLEAERNGYAPPQREKKMDRLASGITGYAQGGTFGFADEVSGAVDFVGGAGAGLLRGEGMGAIESGKEAYSKRVEQDRTLLRKSRSDNPYSTLAGELAGGIITYAPAPAGWMGAGARTTGQVAAQTAAKADKFAKLARAASGSRAARLSAKSADLSSKAARLSLPAKTLGEGAARFGSRVAESAAKGVGYGAAYGGLYGFGAAEGSAADRLDETAQGALIGGAFGGLLSPAIQFVAAPIVGRIGYGMLTSADNKALDVIIKRAERSGTSLQKVQEDFDVWRKTGEVPETLAELMGPNERSLLSALITVNRETREAATDVVVGRGKEEVNLLEDAFGKSFGAGRKDYQKTKAAAMEARAKEAEPFYEGAYVDAATGQRKFLGQNETDALVYEIGGSEVAQETLPTAWKYADGLGKREIRDELKDFAAALAAGRPVKPLSVEAADYIERGINRRYGAATKGDALDIPAGLRGLRDRVRGIIDPSGLGDARATAAEAIRRGELLDEGLGIMSPTVDVDDVNRIMQGVPEAGIPAASPEGRTAYGAGAARAVANALRQVPDMGGFADATRKVARNPALRDKLEAARPKVLTKKGAENKGSKQTKANAALDQAIERASNRAQFGVDMVGNSKTAFRQGDVEDAVLDDAISSQVGQSLSDLLITGVGGAGNQIRDRLARTLGNRLGQPSIYRPQINRAAANVLLATGDQIPVQLARLARRAAQRGMTRITMRGLPPPIAGGAGPTPPSGGSPAGPIRAGGFAGFPTGRFNKRPRSTPESMADHDEKLTNLFGGNPPPPRTPRDVEIERLAQVERDALAELDELDKRVVDMGVDPAILEDRRILPSDVSPNAWPQVQEIMAQMDDAATRLMRARDEVASLRNAPDGDGFGSPLPPNPPRTMGQGLGAGLRGDLGNMAGGALGGGLMPLPSTGDPKKDMQQRLALMGTMALAAGGGPRLVNAFANGARRTVGARNALADTATAGVPGKTKLDMAPEAVKARAREQGFDTDVIVYHGTDTDFKAFDPERSIGGQYWATTNKAAVEAREVGAQGNGVIKAMYQRIKNPAGWAEYDKYGVDELIARGYDGLKLPDRDGHFTFVAFHPNQYRSVNAAFDPDKAASPILTAGIGGGGRKPPNPQAAQAVNEEYFSLLRQGKRREALRLLHKEKGVSLVDSRINRGGAHSPPSASDGAPGYDVASNGIYPDDLYSANGRRYYGTGDDSIDGPAFDVIRSMEANPNKMVTIYRSVEKGASGKINPGDWVTTVRKYAKDHGEANISGDYKIVKKTVFARDIFTDGNSIAEWGYSPQPALPSHRGSYTEDLKRIPNEWKPIHSPDDDLPPIMGNGLGGGGRGPRKPLAAPKMDKQAKAIEDGVRKIVQKQKANSQTGMKIEKPEGRLSKGLSKLSGVMDDPVKAEAQASAMHHAGRSADEIWDATKNIVVKIDGRTLLKRGPYPTQEENIGAFWQAMALPASKRPDWVRRGTKEIFPKGPDAIAQKPFKDRAEYAAKRFSGSAADDASIVNGELLWEETGVVAILKSKNGQPMMMTKGSAVGSKAVAMLDGKQFRSWKEAMDWLKSVAALPRNKQPKWYTDNFSEVLDAKSLRKPTSFEIAPTKARELIRKHPIASRGVALATGGTLGATGVALIANSTDRRQPKNAMAK